MKRVFFLSLLHFVPFTLLAMERDFFGSMLNQAARAGDLACIENYFNSVNRQDEEGRVPLHNAIREGAEPTRLAIVQMFLQHGARVDIRDKYGRAPLHAAAQRGYVDIVQALLQAQANVNIRDESYATPLHVAAFYGNTDVVKTLIAAKASTGPDLCGANPLHYAAQGGHLECVKILVGYDTQLVNILDKDGRTPLHLAIYACRYPIVDFLLKSCADPVVHNSTGQSLLHCAVLQGISLASHLRTGTCDRATIDQDKLAIIQLLLSHGISVDIRDTSDHRTPLHYAAEQGDVSAIVALLRSQADVNAHDAHKSTPLHLAARCGKAEAVQKLIGAGAAIAVDSCGKTPLHYAADNGRLPIVKALVAYNVQLMEIHDRCGMTPLFLAVIAYRYPVINFLVKNGANVSSRDRYQRTPFHYAAATMNEKIMKLLTRRSLDCISHRDKEGKTPLQYAVAKNCLEEAKVVYLQEILSSLSITPYHQMLAFLKALHPRCGSDSPAALLRCTADRRHCAENPVLQKIFKLIQQ